MILSEFKAALSAHPDSNLVFVFDDGDTIPADFHVTEVGHVVKTFVDCGGEKRVAESCQLQVWVAANDPEHRLSAGKLASILELAREIVPSDELPVEVEYEGCVISQYQVSGAEFRDGAIRFSLVDKHTDCLAKEACGLEGANCCGGSGDGCC
ncbi:hypothetical protein GALL_367720 [mine drainage metagenome]|uniref:Uncharacterized protein n=1 Tax=mine drainage metagenome TaxID=410659 RepID=A0A1J5QNI8_9ZZZZ